jgi:uncharacterized protein
VTDTGVFLESKEFSNKINMEIIDKAREYSKLYMSQYDSSHDFAHVERVVALAKRLVEMESKQVDVVAIELAALLHDVNDHKYFSDRDENFVQKVLIEQLSCPPELAVKVNNIVKHCSFTYEIQNGASEEYQNCIKQFEIQILQDADRLDAIGAIGIARCFTFGGSRNRSLQEGLDHFDEKLFKIEGMMKTEAGKEMAASRTKCLYTFYNDFKGEL